MSAELDRTTSLEVDGEKYLPPIRGLFIFKMLLVEEAKKEETTNGNKD